MHERISKRARSETLAAADARLLAVLRRDGMEAKRRAGAWLRCEAGCNACCRGLFPITRLDQRRLVAGLRVLAATDAARAAAVRARAERAARELARELRGNDTTATLPRDGVTLDRFFERHRSHVCPALDPVSGGCDLYDHRPVVCRTYGPPLRFGEEETPPCDLCFAGAPAQVVADCRIEPDRDGLEDAILRRMGESASDAGTLVAFALTLPVS